MSRTVGRKKHSKSAGLRWSLVEELAALAPPEELPSESSWSGEPPPDTLNGAVLWIELYSGKLCKAIRDMCGGAFEPVVWQVFEGDQIQATDVADMRDCLQVVERHTPAGLRGLDLREALAAVAVTSGEFACLRWKTWPDYRAGACGGVDDDYEPSGVRAIYLRRLTDADAEAAMTAVVRHEAAVRRLVAAARRPATVATSASAKASPGLKRGARRRQPGQAVAGPPPDPLLLNWHQIMAVVNRGRTDGTRIPDTEPGHRQVRRLHAEHPSPISFPTGSGGQPRVRESDLVAWLASIPTVATTPKLAKGR